MPETPASTLAATVSSLDTPADSHTSTAQWQSFETRMQQRRAQRCLLRAEAALDAGLVDYARQPLDEARRLDPTSPELAAVERRLAASGVAAPVSVPLPGRLALSGAVAACLILSLAGLMGWRALTRGSPTDAMRPRVGHDILLAAPASVAFSAPASVAFSAPASVELTAPGSIVPPSRPMSAAKEPAAAGPTIREPSLEPVSRPAPQVPPDAAAPTAVNVDKEVDREIAPAPLPAENPVATHQDAKTAAPAGSAGVRAALSRYEAAYSRLDAAAAHEVWPAVDERTLARAFDGLVLQRVSLGKCDVRVDGDTAHATCLGSATWTPKIGGGQRTESRRWAFELKDTDAGWHILNVRTLER
jgi:hypothetical protein